MIVSSGTYSVRSGTTLEKPTVAANGMLVVYSSGVVQSALVNSCNASKYAGLYVSSGGTAVDTTINPGGAFYVYEGDSAIGPRDVAPSRLRPRGRRGCR